MFGFWRLWILLTILVLGWAGICYMLTRNRQYLRYMRRITAGSGLLMALISAFWVVALWIE